MGEDGYVHNKGEQNVLRDREVGTRTFTEVKKKAREKIRVLDQRLGSSRTPALGVRGETVTTGG